MRAVEKNKGRKGALLGQGDLSARRAGWRWVQRVRVPRGPVQTRIKGGCE